MSKAELQRVSKLDRPLTDEEKAYLHERSRDWEIDENDRKHGNKTDFAEIPLFSEVTKEPEEANESERIDLSEFDPDLVKEVQSLNTADLQAELKQRKIGYPADSSQAHLQFLLIEAVSKSGK